MKCPNLRIYAACRPSSRTIAKLQVGSFRANYTNGQGLAIINSRFDAILGAAIRTRYIIHANNNCEFPYILARGWATSDRRRR